MKAIRLLILLPFLLTPFWGTAQNLVQNGSFEIFEKGKCPDQLRSDNQNIKLAPGWTWPTVHGTADHFHACGPSGLTNVPKTAMGYCPAKHGQGFAGVILKTHKVGGKDYREYMQNELTKPMVKDKVYCISFFYRLADCSSFSIDRIGMYFSETEVNINTDKTIGFNPHLETPSNQFLDNDKEWKAVYNMYRANGGEKFLLLGNFRNDDNTPEKRHEKQGDCSGDKDYAYYYIDSVQVMEVKWECEPCVCIPQDLKVEIERGECFNGGTDLIANVTGGTEPYRRFYWEDGSTDMFYKHAITGKHVATIVDDWGCKKEAVIEYDCGQPLRVAVSDSGYTGGTDGFIKLKITGGIEPYKFLWSNGETTKDINGLSFGTYKYQVTDAQGVVENGSVTFSVPKLTASHEAHYTDFNDGTIKITVKTGLPPYKFKWKHGAEGEQLDSLSAGWYVYTVIDAANQMVADSVHFIAPIKATAQTGFTFESDGSVELSINGGCPPYTVKWSNDSTTTSMKYLENGLYRYTITCACNKTFSDTVRIRGKIILKNILFKTGSAELLPESFPELDKVVSYMQRRGKIKVEISGHTDNVGSDDLNKKLSENRAKSVVEYIASKGIGIERMVYKGYGKDRPVASNDTKEGKALNRRVEFDILDQ